MRKVILMLVILGLPTFSHAETQGEALVRNLCEYIKADNRSQVRKKLKRAKLKFRVVYPGATCNGLTLLQWAEKHKAENMIKFIKTKVKDAT